MQAAVATNVSKSVDIEERARFIPTLLGNSRLWLTSIQDAIL